MQNALLGPCNGKEAAIVILDAPPDDLEGTDDDGLIWYECNPDYEWNLNQKACERLRPCVKRMLSRSSRMK
jgi:hypothetical protein